MNGARTEDFNSRTERTLCLFGWSTTVESMGGCHETPRSFATGQTSDQKVFSNPTPAPRRKPDFAIASDEMAVQWPTVLISVEVFF